MSVTGALVKIFEQVIRNHIKDYLFSNNLLSPKQVGYRKKVSTTDAILQCTEYVRTEMGKKKTVCIYISVYISQEKLLEKLKYLGFDGTSTHLIRSYLKDRTQKVVFSGNESDWILLNRGMPQGTLLGPFLFNIYVNDLHKAIDNGNCPVIQYANDLSLYSSLTNENIDRIYLEKIIEELCFYFPSHQLKMNNKKTEHILFAPSKKHKIHHISMLTVRPKKNRR